MYARDLVVTPQQYAQLRALAHELSADCWSESKWLEGVKKILGRDDLWCEHKYGPTWASVSINVVADKTNEGTTS